MFCASPGRATTRGKGPVPGYAGILSGSDCLFYRGRAYTPVSTIPTILSLQILQTLFYFDVPTLRQALGLRTCQKLCEYMVGRGECGLYLDGKGYFHVSPFHLRVDVFLFLEKNRVSQQSSSGTLESGGVGVSILRWVPR